MLSAVHAAAAPVVAVLAIALGVVAVIAARGRDAHRNAIDRLILVVLVVALAAGATGAVLLATGHRPSDPLHLLYAAVAVAALPIARFAGGSVRWTSRSWVLAGAAIVLIGVVLRLVATG